MSETIEYRIKTPNVKLYQDSRLSSQLRECFDDLTKDVIIRGTKISNSVLYIEEPYYIYCSMDDVEQVNNNNPQINDLIPTPNFDSHSRAGSMATQIIHNTANSVIVPNNVNNNSLKPIRAYNEIDSPITDLKKKSFDKVTTAHMLDNMYEVGSELDYDQKPNNNPNNQHNIQHRSNNRPNKNGNNKNGINKNVHKSMTPKFHHQSTRSHATNQSQRPGSARQPRHHMNNSSFSPQTTNDRHARRDSSRLDRHDRRDSRRETPRSSHSPHTPSRSHNSHNNRQHTPSKSRSRDHSHSRQHTPVNHSKPRRDSSNHNREHSRRDSNSHARRDSSRSVSRSRRSSQRFDNQNNIGIIEPTITNKKSNQNSKRIHTPKQHSKLNSINKMQRPNLEIQPSISYSHSNSINNNLNSNNNVSNLNKPTFERFPSYSNDISQFALAKAQVLAQERAIEIKVESKDVVVELEEEHQKNRVKRHKFGAIGLILGAIVIVVGLLVYNLYVELAGAVVIMISCAYLGGCGYKDKRDEFDKKKKQIKELQKKQGIQLKVESQTKSSHTNNSSQTGSNTNTHTKGDRGW